MLADKKAELIQKMARAAGFDLCGIAPAEVFPELARLPEWLDRGYAGEMRYLADDRRQDPSRVVPGARSVIVCALNYNTSAPCSTEAAAALQNDGAPHAWISRYAWGRDYHNVVGEKLEELLRAVRAHFTDSFEARAYVDTGPVVERVAAKYAGLGWLAKNTCLINEQLGSWLFLGVIVTTLELEPALASLAPPPDLCGNCRLCLDACPTEALVEPYVLDARRCISYLTIELRGTIPEELRPGVGRMVFGCDICQDVCPWNRKAPASSLAAFQPREFTRESATQNEDPVRTKAAAHDSLLSPSLEWLASLSLEEFRGVFRDSAVKRTKWSGLIRNACVALGNARLAPGSSEHARVVSVLRGLADSADALIAEHARWALARLETI